VIHISEIIHLKAEHHYTCNSKRTSLYIAII